jgi:hypothetical protein
VRSRDRGRAVVSWSTSGDAFTYSYEPITGDPLGLGEWMGLDERDAHDVTHGSDYPDALVQIARLASCARSGDLILSASRGWDFRGRYEPIPHVSSHGALHREHMLVPLLANHPIAGRPRRTVDVMTSACAALGVTPRRTEGESFLAR